MAKLQDTIAKNKSLVRGPGGVLQEDTQEEVQKLAGQAGLQAPPTTAIGGAMIGANPDQQKMMGGPAQMQAALRLSQEAGNTLQNADRRRQARDQATEGEQQEQQKSADLQNLGGVGDRVSQFIDVQRQKLAANTNVQAGAADDATLAAANKGQAQADQVALKEALKTLRVTPGDMNAQLRVNQLLGRQVNSVISPDEINNLYQSTVSALSQGGADTVDNDLQVEDLAAIPEFGYDVATLSQLMGIPEAELGKYTVAQLRNRLQSVADAEFSSVESNQKAAGSMNLGMAERNVARGMGQEASRTGIRSTEADVARLEKAIENADQVSFGGQQYQVDQLLQDDTISGIISDYFNAPEGSPTRQQLEASEPGLVQFIKQNEAVLAEAAKQLSGGAGEFGTIQKENQALQQVGTSSIDTGLMKELIPGFGDLASNRYDANQIPFLAKARSLPPEQGQALVNTANALVNNPITADAGKELAQLSPDQLNRLQLELGANSVPVKQFVENRQKDQALNQTDPADADRIVNLFTGGQYSDDGQLKQVFNENKVANILGLPAGDISRFDSDKDGNIDSGQTLLQIMKQGTPKASLADAADGNVKTAQAVSMDRKALNPTQEMAFKKLYDKVLDGDFSVDDFWSVGFSEDEMYQMGDEGVVGNWPAAVRQRLSDHLANERYKRYRAVEDTFPPANLSYDERNSFNSGQIGDRIAYGNDRLNILRNQVEEMKRSSNPRKYDVGSLENYVRKLEQSQRELEIARDQKAEAEENARRREAEAAARRAAEEAQARKEAEYRGSIQGKLAYGAEQAGEIGQLPLDALAGTVGGLNKTVDAVTKWCFRAGTKFRMSDESLKAIENIQLGNYTLYGGKVVELQSNIADDMYLIAGVYVTGDHPIHRDGRWQLVRQQNDATRIPGEYKVYCLTNETHLLISDNGMIFGDFECDENYMRCPDPEVTIDG